MSHPTPWQLELHALGEDVPEVRAHLPCPICDAELVALSADPGLIPPSVLDGIGAAGPPVWASTWFWVAVAAGVAGLIGGGLLVPPAVDAIRTPTLEGSIAVDQPDPETPARVVKTEVVAPAPETPPSAPLELPEPLPEQVRPAQSWSIPSTGRGHALNPVWSRDGAHLAFEVNNYGDRSDLYLVSELTGEPSRVKLPGGGPFASGSQVVVNPVWHPQGIVVFEGSNAGGVFRLYYYQPGAGAAAEMISMSEVPGDLVFPEIDARGESLAFVADQTGNGDLRIRNTSSGRVETWPETDATELFPRFSPKGDRLLFTRKVEGDEDIFERNLATDAVERIVGGPNDQSRPEWTEAGVAYFDHGDGSRWSIKVASAGTSWTLADDVRLPVRARPAVSPDRAWVAYALDDPFHSGAMLVSRADGSQTVVIDVDGVAVGEPSLGERDGRLLLAYTALPDSDADYRGLYVADITALL